MCTYITLDTQVSGSGLANGDWFRLSRAVVYFDHPQDAPVDHALCLDFRPAGGPPELRSCVELDAGSARRLAETILDLLDREEVRQITAG
ncbi:MAG TPA: DUF6295 family protein [Acidimicrobiales bacterium]|nr:DUF6295 family protein [Acidimicrobiales bacterium]